MKVVVAAGIELPGLAGWDVVVVQKEERADRLPLELANADAFVTAGVTAGELAKPRRLRLVQSSVHGLDWFDLDAIPPGCAVCAAAGIEQPVAEWALAAALAMGRHLAAYDRALRNGEWRWPQPIEPQRELAGRLMGIVGLGQIGTYLARIARGIGMRVAAVTRTPASHSVEGLEWLGGLDDLPRLAEEAEVLVVAVPRTSETEGLIGARELELLGRQGILVNVARGPIVQEEPLYEALRDGRLGSAALDVWYTYPDSADAHGEPSRFPFRELDNVLMSPHASGFSRESRVRRDAFVVEQLHRLERVEPLQNVAYVG